MVPPAVDGDAGDRDLLPALVRELLPQESIGVEADLIASGVAVESREGNDPRTLAGAVARDRKFAGRRSWSSLAATRNWRLTPQLVTAALGNGLGNGALWSPPTNVATYCCDVGY